MALSASTQNTEGLHCVGRHRYLLSGTFFPNGSSAIVAASNIGTAGWSVLYTSTGLYTVTLQNAWLYLAGKSLSFAVSAATAVFPQWGAIDVSTNGTLQIRSINGSGSVTDIAANAANTISFMLLLSNDTVQP